MKERNEARSAPEGASPEGSKSNPGAPKEGQAPAREEEVRKASAEIQGYFLESELGDRPYEALKTLERLAMAAPVSPSLEAPKAAEALRKAAQRVSDAFYADGTGESMRPSMEALTEILDAIPPPSPVQGGATPATIGVTENALRERVDRLQRVIRSALNNLNWGDSPTHQEAAFHGLNDEVKTWDVEPAPAVQGAPTEAGPADLREAFLRGAYFACEREHLDALDIQAAADKFIALSAQRGEGGEKKPTPEAGGGGTGSGEAPSPEPGTADNCCPTCGAGAILDQDISALSRRLTCPHDHSWYMAPKASPRAPKPSPAEGPNPLRNPKVTGGEAGGAQDGEAITALAEIGDDIDTLCSDLKFRHYAVSGPDRDAIDFAAETSRKVDRLLARLRSLPLSEGPKGETPTNNQGEKP